MEDKPASIGVGGLKTENSEDDGQSLEMMNTKALNLGLREEEEGAR